MSTPHDRILIGDAGDIASESLCGCTGGGAASPGTPTNAPALPAVNYRVGAYPAFREAALAALSSAAHPALRRLGTRAPADFTIALLDAWAVTGDVLTFYQERLANEQFLRTATERLSVVELARLVGYLPSPGVAAGTHMAFTLDAARADAAVAPQPLTIARGARVQSIPGAGEQAQTFETLEDFIALPEWNVLEPQKTLRRLPVEDDTELYVEGIATGLRPGDALLMVGDERIAEPRDNHWDFRRIASVTPDNAGNRTRLTWQKPLGSDVPRMTPALNPRIFALRLRASLFGHNTLHPRLLHKDTLALFNGEYDASNGVGDWIFSIARIRDENRVLRHALLELDGVHPTVAEGAWLVLSRPDYQELYRVDEVSEVANSRYAMSGKRTRVRTDVAVNIDGFERDYRHTAVFTQSEELALAGAPVTEPVDGSTIALETRVATLDADRPLIFRGRRPRLRVLKHLLVFTPLSGSTRRLAKLTELFVLAAGTAVAGQPERTRWPVRDLDGVDGSVVGAPGEVEIVAARKDDERIAELAFLRSCEQPVGGTTRLELRAALSNSFDRGSLEIFANVAEASHGESVSEILGSGSARLARQSFKLKQTPLTYVSAAGPSGIASSLEVRVEDVLWHEVGNLLAALPSDRVYVTRRFDDGSTVVEFGDGIHGQRLPSGRDNVRATYRKGIGIAALVRAEQLTTPLRMPLGVKSVTNPLAASGAADPETRDGARRNAPMAVRTLDRTVSLRDYQDFALTFAGIDKALATWTWDGYLRRVLLTVAGANGAVIPADSELLRNLIDALAAAGQPTATFEVRPFVPVHFRVHMAVKVHADHVPDVVLANVTAALHAAFDFARREFGQAVSQSEVIAVAQAVEGVVAIDLDALYRTTPPNDTAILHPRLPALAPRRDAANRLLGAELLMLEPGPLTSLGQMS